MTDKETPIVKILLPLDVSIDSLSALEAAFRLAAALGGEVSGLFIEDKTLLVAGSLPFAREIGSRSGIPRRIGTLDIENSLRGVARRAQEALAQAGRRLHVESSFHVTRGDIAAEILTAAGGADLIVLGRTGWSEGVPRRVGSTCLTVVSQSRVPVLIVERGAVLAPPIVVVNHGTPASQRALEFARGIGGRLGWPIVTVMPEDVISNRESRLLVVPSTLAVTTYGEFRGAILVVP